MNFKSIATKLTKEANLQLKHDRIVWCGKPSMIKMLVDDCKDTKLVANLIREEKFEEATNAMYDCDTACREIIFGMLGRIDKEFVIKYID